jgi:hypothetical protein
MLCSALWHCYFSLPLGEGTYQHTEDAGFSAMHFFKIDKVEGISFAGVLLED